MRLHNIQKQYAENTAIAEIDTHFENNQIHGLLGVNGAGKSTLIKIIMGLVHASSGYVELAPESDRRQHLSFLPEQANLPLNLSALHLLRFACRIKGEHESNAETLLAKAGLKESAWKKQIRTYSKGMRQRTAVAYTLAGTPDWLILDEPMSGLDVLGRRHILDLLLEFRQQGHSILMCSHIVTDIARICDQVHIVSKGKIVETIAIKDHSIDEALMLENSLASWNQS